MARVTQVKVVILGGAAVGKTCLIKRYVDKIFGEYDRYQATIGAVFASKSVKRGRQTVVFNLWDTAGEEKFQSMTRLYYRGAHVAVICYDMTDVTSFERLRYWVEELSAFEENCRVYICGTKKDLVTNVRKIHPETVAYYVEGISAKAIETSSKTGENIDELFEMITTDMLDSQLSIMPESEKDSTVNLTSKTPKKKCCNR